MTTRTRSQNAFWGRALTCVRSTATPCRAARRTSTCRGMIRLVPLLMLSIVLSACGAGPRADVRSLEVSAIALRTAGDAIALSAEADAESSCPVSVPDLDACLYDVALRWAPVDRAYTLARAALGAWYATTIATQDQAQISEAIRAYVEAYEALVALAEPLDSDLRLR